MCVQTCVYRYMHACVCACLPLSLSSSVLYPFPSLHACMYVCLVCMLRVNMHACVCIFSYVYMYVCMYVCVCACVPICVRACMCGCVRVWTDHKMLRSKVAFRIRKKHNWQGTNKPTNLKTAKLSTISHRESFEQEMDSALAQWEEKENSTQDEEWAALQQVVYNTAKTYLGKPDIKKTRLVRPQRQGATYSYEQKRPNTPESVANQYH